MATDSNVRQLRDYRLNPANHNGNGNGNGGDGGGHDGGGDGGGHDGGGGLIERIARLETHMQYVATKEDVQTLRTEVESVRTEVESVRTEVQAVRTEMESIGNKLMWRIGGLVGILMALVELIKWTSA